MSYVQYLLNYSYKINITFSNYFFAYTSYMTIEWDDQKNIENKQKHA